MSSMNANANSGRGGELLSGHKNLSISSFLVGISFVLVKQ